MYLKSSKIIVIKIGSSLLIDNKMRIRQKWLSEFTKDIKNFKANQKNSGCLPEERAWLDDVFKKLGWTIFLTVIFICIRSLFLYF